MKVSVSLLAKYSYDQHRNENSRTNKPFTKADKRMAVQLWMATNHHQEPAKEGREKTEQLAFVMTNPGAPVAMQKRNSGPGTLNRMQGSQTAVTTGIFKKCSSWKVYIC